MFYSFVYIFQSFITKNIKGCYTTYVIQQIITQSVHLGVARRHVAIVASLTGVCYIKGWSDCVNIRLWPEPIITQLLSVSVE